MIWLSKEQIVYLPALQAPMQTYESKELFPSVIEKSARLACGLTQFHPFIDGNKRIGAHAMLVILELNGFSVTYTQKELSEVFLRLAAGECDYEELRDWLRAHIKSEKL